MKKGIHIMNQKKQTSMSPYYLLFYIQDEFM